MSKIMISELQETTSAPDSSYIAIDNGTTTNKITIANYNENANATAKRYAEASQGYSNDALTAKDGAVSAKNEAETLANTASSYANAARASADAAAGSASEASGYVGSAQTSATNALASARAAEASAAGIDDQVKLAKSWAVGNTGVRADEAVNNSMYWAGQAAAAAGGGVVSFNGRTGSVLPNAGDYSSDQIAHVNSDSTYSNVETEINNLQTSRLKTYASDATQWDAAPTANSTKPVTSGGIKAQFDLIDTQITDINEDIADVNAEIADLHAEDSRLSTQISNIANWVLVDPIASISGSSSGSKPIFYQRGKELLMVSFPHPNTAATVTVTLKSEYTFKQNISFMVLNYSSWNKDYQVMLEYYLNASSRTITSNVSTQFAYFTLIAPVIFLLE